MFCGFRTAQPFASCGHLKNCFANFTSLDGFDECLEFDVHANLHAMHAGMWDCSVDVSQVRVLEKFAQREDGLLRVSVCKPGGTASKKVRLNDVLLATTYVVMVPDPTGERRAGVPELEWMDAVREGHSFNTLQEAMLTHSQEMKLRLARGDVPLGALAATSASVSAPPEESPAAEAERRYREAESAREMAKKSMRAAAAAGAEVPDDIKAWAAKIAAEARATRGA